MNQQAAIFIDGAYLRRVLADEFNKVRVDFNRLAITMASGTDILRTYYYNSLPYLSDPPTAEQSRRYAITRGFHNALDLLPRFEVRLGQLEFRGNDAGGNPVFEQKRVDIMLAVDLVQLAAKGHIQQAVLLAGDSDFIPAIAVAKAEGVLVRLFHGGSCHNDLLREVDERVRLDRAFIDAILRE